ADGMLHWARLRRSHSFRRSAAADFFMEKQIIFTTEPIIIPALGLPSHEIGACVEFQGIVRESEQGRPLAGLQYEAYESMAVRQLERIFEELTSAHPCAAVTF